MANTLVPGLELPYVDDDGVMIIRGSQELSFSTGSAAVAANDVVRREFIIPISGFGTGVAKPIETIVGNYVGYAFSINDIGYFVFEVPGDWDLASDMAIGIHWYCDEAYALNSGEVQWSVIFSAVNEDGGEAIDAATTPLVSGDINIPATAKHLVNTIIPIPEGSIAPHDMLGFQIKRIAIDGGTDPTAKPVVIAAECQYDANPI